MQGTSSVNVLAGLLRVSAGTLVADAIVLIGSLIVAKRIKPMTVRGLEW